MVELSRLTSYCHDLLAVGDFEDYCPNGLQVEATGGISRLVTGVTASQALIEAAADLGGDGLLVHHGYFWKGESPCLTGMKGRRIRTLFDHGINLLAYHLPLDCHPELGNNRRLGDELGILDAAAVAEGDLLWRGRLAAPTPGPQLARHIGARLGREVTHIAGNGRPIEALGWCTGAAQGLITRAAALGLEGYISGEISEQTAHQARELGIHYFSAGHHATERLGVQALGDRLARQFGIEHRFVDIANPA